MHLAVTALCTWQPALCLLSGVVGAHVVGAHTDQDGSINTTGHSLKLGGDRSQSTHDSAYFPHGFQVAWLSGDCGGIDALLCTVLVTCAWTGSPFFRFTLPALSLTFLLPPDRHVCTHILISGSISGITPIKIVVDFVSCHRLSLEGSRRDIHWWVTW